MFTVSNYTPGCLPDDESHVTEFDSAIDAFNAWRDDINAHIDALGDSASDDDVIRMYTELITIELDALACLQSGGSVYYDIENIRYAIERS